MARGRAGTGRYARTPEQNLRRKQQRAERARELIESIGDIPPDIYFVLRDYAPERSERFIRVVRSRKRQTEREVDYDQALAEEREDTLRKRYHDTLYGKGVTARRRGPDPDEPPPDEDQDYVAPEDDDELSGDWDGSVDGRDNRDKYKQGRVRWYKVHGTLAPF